jgi:hypothetical protein
MDQIIKEIAKKLHTKKWRVKEAIGLQVDECPAKTVDEARSCCQMARSRSKAEYLAIKKWDELSLQEVEASFAVGIEALRHACMRARKDSPAEKLAIKRIYELMLQ